MRRTHRSFGLFFGLAAIAVPARAHAADAPASLTVTRTAHANECPDAPALAAAIAHLREGAPAIVADDEAAKLKVDVAFFDASPGFTAKLHFSGTRTGERTIADGYPSCAALADAVALAVSVILDEHVATIESTPPKAIDPADIPPFAKSELRPMPRAKTETHWYGAKTLSADAVAVGLIIVGSQASVPALSEIGVGTYVLGAPIMHVTEGNAGRAFGDLGIRVGFPLVGAMIGAGIDASLSSSSCSPKELVCFRGASGAEIGLLAGLAGAVILDATVFASERVAPKGDEAPPTAPAVSFAPSFRVSQRGASVGLGGAF